MQDSSDLEGKAFCIKQKMGISKIFETSHPGRWEIY
jgi:hypothetical protein